MSVSSVVTRGYRTSIASVVLRGYSAAVLEESDSTAGLRYYSRTLDMPGVLLGSSMALFDQSVALEVSGMLGGDARAAFEREIVGVLGIVAELGETAVVSGSSMNVIGITPYAGAVMAGTEMEGRRVVLYVGSDDFDAASGALGDAVTFRSVSYTIGRIERFDAPLVRLELVR